MCLRIVCIAEVSLMICDTFSLLIQLLSKDSSHNAILSSLNTLHTDSETLMYRQISAIFLKVHLFDESLLKEIPFY